ACPHLEHLSGDGTIEEATDIVLQFASDAGLPVDLHTDETLDPAANGLDHAARRVLEGFDLPLTASHCVSLDQQDASIRCATIERVVAAEISVVALPHTNLFLQGRGRSPMPRGLTAVAELIDAGANVAAGADNLQDPFNPVGRACAFETAGLMVMAAHRLPADAWHMVSAASARALGRPSGVEVGLPADLIAVEAATIREAIAMGRPPRHVWRHGHSR
ncbi:MAG: amidohydrolase family protein, partial [Actinomycetota bacterium]